MMSKTAFVTGITGQIASIIVKKLLKKNYEIYGLVRRNSTKNYWRLIDIEDKINFIEGDLTDQSSLFTAVKEANPDLIINCGAQSFVGTSWKQPVYTENVTSLGVTRLLEAAKMFANDAKIIQLSSSEMFGAVRETPQSETTQFYPRSPYGVAKVAGFWNTVCYRESWGMDISNAICFNMESEWRGIEFVTRKISAGIANINEGVQEYITLGNLDAKRDWSYANDSVDAMLLMTKEKEYNDYVISSGETNSIRDFIKEGFKVAGIDDWKKHIKQDPKFFRPAEVELLLGDSTKIKNKLGWEPKTKFKELVKIMVEKDIERVENGEMLF